MKTGTRNNEGETAMTTPRDKAENLRWTGFATSIPGGGHIRHGIPCQDASAVLTSPRPAVIVCDGRGSAALSHFGAQGAVDAFRFQMSILEPFLVSILDSEEEKQEQWIKFCRIMYRTLMQVKYDLAEKHSAKEKEFDCTVAFVIAGEKHIGCFQVGDGSIVLRQNGICRTVFLPEKGEYANQTHFLRPGGEEQMNFQHALLDAEANSGIALTSDGPEHLMFHLADMTPGKIFDVLLDDLRQNALCEQDLRDYLTRREWADDPRGSDDRSLALLARIGDEPAGGPVPEVKVAAEPVIERFKAPEAGIEVQADAQIEPQAEAEVGNAPAAEVQPVVHSETETGEKKENPYRTLAIVGALAIGLLAETAGLLMQHQTIIHLRQEILRQHQTAIGRQQEILNLKQQLARLKTSPEETSQPATPLSAPTANREESTAALPRQVRAPGAANGTEQGSVSRKEKTSEPNSGKNPERGNPRRDKDVFPKEKK